jgi:hypothetical protein
VLVGIQIESPAFHQTPKTGRRKTGKNKTGKGRRLKNRQPDPFSQVANDEPIT